MKKNETKQSLNKNKTIDSIRFYLNYLKTEKSYELNFEHFNDNWVLDICLLNNMHFLERIFLCSFISQNNMEKHRIG